MAKYPSEIFGYYWKDASKDAQSARKKHHCPFHNSECFKKSRLVAFPFGVCTAHTDDKEIALCPRRFFEDGIVLRDIAKAHFGSIHNIVVFSEVGLPGIGNFDFVMVKHKPLSTIVEDFAAIELQTRQTTSTGKLVEGFKDFMESGTFAPGTTYNFGINTYDIWKRTFTQILNKGIILEKWRRKYSGSFNSQSLITSSINIVLGLSNTILPIHPFSFSMTYDFKATVSISPRLAFAPQL